MIDIDDLLQKSGAIVNGHFVYKAGTHSAQYIDKERFANLPAWELSLFIREVALNAVGKGLRIPADAERIGVIGPAMGAIPFALTLATCLEECFPAIQFFPARTELTTGPDGKAIHIIPDKLLDIYQNAMFIIGEDIINNGTTVREIKALFEKAVGGNVIAALCIVDRGEQTASSLGVGQYFPLKRFPLEQWHPKKETCPLCERGMPISLNLGKGFRWEKLFGHPPYAPDADFSAFWE